MCRMPQHQALDLTAYSSNERILRGAVLPTHSSPGQTPLSVSNLWQTPRSAPNMLPALQIPHPNPANLLQPKPLSRRWTWQACLSGIHAHGSAALRPLSLAVLLRNQKRIAAPMTRMRPSVSNVESHSSFNPPKQVVRL